MMRSARRTLAVTAAAGFLGSGLLSWQLLSPERGLEGSFRQSLARHDGSQPVKTSANMPLPSDTFGAGLWLSGLDVAASGDDAAPMEIGSHIAISARDGDTRHLQIIDIRPTSNPLHDANEAVPASLLMVTLRPVGQGSGREIRILIEAPGATKPPASSARAL